MDALVNGLTCTHLPPSPLPSTPSSCDATAWDASTWYLANSYLSLGHWYSCLLASGYVWSEKLGMGPAWKLGYPKVCDHHHWYYGEHYCSQAGQDSASITAGSLRIFNFQQIFDTLYQMTQTAAMVLHACTTRMLTLKLPKPTRS